MAIQYRTRKNVSPNGKQKVYFTCHPEDFDKYSDCIISIILSKCDCAIWFYGKKDDGTIEESNPDDFYQFTLFVVPVTGKLLTTANRAMDVEIKYAVENHIPILPIMMEDGWDDVFRIKFGDRQYLCFNEHDESGLSFANKLEKRLGEVVIGDEMASNIRKAFDAYIFMSYRKKDKKYARELMGLIHDNPFFRDIAIWYDEFLTPGENYKEEIENYIDKCRLFAMVVTPNLLEKTGDEYNYVAKIEYPLAKEHGRNIFPAGMVDTDYNDLKRIYEGIPLVTNPYDANELSKDILDRIEGIALRKTDKDPEHNFFIGLAYLNGIDVEVNNKRALELITDSADKGLIEAMEKLADMYEKGDHVELNYKEELKWQKRIVEYYENNYGEDNIATVLEREDLGECYFHLGRYREALEIHEHSYELLKEMRGEEDHITLLCLNNIALNYGNLGQVWNALEASERLYEIRKRAFGDEHPATLTCQLNLASKYNSAGNIKKALEINTRVYDAQKRILEETDPDFLACRNNMITYYNNLGDYKAAAKIGEETYAITKKALGENNPLSLTIHNNLAMSYNGQGDYGKALEIFEQVFETRRKLFGYEHKDTQLVYNNLGRCLCLMGEHERALEVLTKAYEIQKTQLGENHPLTLTIQNNLSACYHELEDNNTALEIALEAYEIRKTTLGENHPDTLTSKNNIAFYYSQIGESEKALEIGRQAYEATRDLFGEDHPRTVISLADLSLYYFVCGDNKKALEALEKSHNDRKRVFGENHPEYYTSQDFSSYMYLTLRKYKKALEIYEQIYERLKSNTNEELLDCLCNMKVCYLYRLRIIKAVKTMIKISELKKRLK